MLEYSVTIIKEIEDMRTVEVVDSVSTTEETEEIIGTVVKVS